MISRAILLKSGLRFVPIFSFCKHNKNPKEERQQPNFKQEFGLGLKESFKLTRIYRRLRKNGKKRRYPLRRLFLTVTMFFTLMLGLKGKDILFQQELKKGFATILDEIIFTFFKRDPSTTNVSKYLQRLFQITIFLFNNDIYDIKFLNEILLKVIDISTHYPMSSHTYGQIFCFLSLVVSKLTVNNPDGLLNTQFEQYMEEVVQNYVTFMETHQNQPMDDVFLGKEVKFFSGVFQYILMYSKEPNKVINLLHKLSSLNTIIGHELVENSNMLRELIRQLSLGKLQVIDLFLQVSKNKEGCQRLHKMNIIHNLKTHVSKPQTKQRIEQIIKNCPK